MKHIIMKSWGVEDLRLNVDSVLRGQGGDPGIMKIRSPRLVALAEKALEQGTRLLKPAVLYKQLGVKAIRHNQLILEDGSRISGEFIPQHLALAETVIAVICTVGRELEDYASKVSGTDLAFGMALDGVGSAGVEALANAVCHSIEEDCLKAGLHSTIPLSPGMVGWPVENGQTFIFEILKPEKIGVNLNPHFMMIPRKTISILIGLGKELENSGGPCDFCSMNITCRFKDLYQQGVKN